MNTDPTDPNPDLTKLEQERDALKHERDALLRWKAKAEQVEQDWDAQAIATMLGARLGQSCRKVIMAEVPKMVQERDELRTVVGAFRSVLNGIADIFVKLDSHQSVDLVRLVKARVAALTAERDELRASLEKIRAERDELRTERDALKKGIDITDAMHRKASTETLAVPPFVFVQPPWVNGPKAETAEESLKRAASIASAYYPAGVQTGIHSMIEWCGVMTEYVKMLEEAHKAGIDPREVDKHHSQAVTVPEFMMSYFGEKLGCQLVPFIRANPLGWRYVVDSWFKE